MADEEAYLTATVTGSKIAFRADGTTALVLQLEEGPPIAFALDLRAVGLLRRNLAKAEALLRQQSGTG